MAAEGTDTEQIGPIDYLVLEWTGQRPNGEIAPHLIDLVDRGLIRILDLVFLEKDEDGNVIELDVVDVGREVPELAVFEGVSSGLVDDGDREEAGAILEPGTAAALLIYENVWAAPLAEALRRSGGELVASGRIPLQEIAAALAAGDEE
ncbi:MAG: DUF1269 domain-containing protein [Actinobacteria bacterium]|nr:DUF1269 domain-containing protein [Actinomycetota bacterium]